jgi:hypothetical protein
MLQQNIDFISRNRRDDIIDETFPKRKRYRETEAKALCSTSSITKLAITADTGDPIAVPKPVVNNCPQTQSMWY